MATIFVIPPQSARAASIEVDSLADSGPGSLREAIAKANVDGSAAPGLTVSGNDTSRIFVVNNGSAELTIDRMQLTEGFNAAEGGGAIASPGDIVIRSSIISSSEAVFSGGAVLSEGRVTIQNSELKENSAEFGGPIQADEVIVEDGSLITANSAVDEGGAIRASSVFEIRNSTVSDNVACSVPFSNGGGVSTNATDSIIEASTLFNNRCDTESGGAIYFRYGEPLSSPEAGSPSVPVEPARLLDTRDLGVTIDTQFRGEGRQRADTELVLDVGGRYGIPDDAAAVVVNVVAVRPSARGFLTVHGCVDDRPLSSSLNYVAGGNRANDVLAGLDADGRLCIYTAADADLLADVVGYLPAGSDLTPVEPARVYETRTNTSTVDGEFSGGGKSPAGTTTRVQIAGRAGVAADATSVNINVTAVAATAAGFATIYPCGDRPLASSLNYIPGVNGGNDLVAELDADGGLCVFNLSETHLTIDVTGYTTL